MDNENKLTDKYIETLFNIQSSIDILNQQKDAICFEGFEDYFIEIKRLKKMEKLINKIINSYGITIKDAPVI
jgi:CRISPR/Cas system-associated exonuclease Cas4 (RecB family)